MDNNANYLDMGKHVYPTYKNQADGKTLSYPLRRGCGKILSISLTGEDLEAMTSKKEEFQSQIQIMKIGRCNY